MVAVAGRIFTVGGQEPVRNQALLGSKRASSTRGHQQEQAKQRPGFLHFSVPLFTREIRPGKKDE
jgi:hypothetical protein